MRRFKCTINSIGISPTGANHSPPTAFNNILIKSLHLEMVIICRINYGIRRYLLLLSYQPTAEIIFNVKHLHRKDFFEFNTDFNNTALIHEICMDLFCEGGICKPRIEVIQGCTTVRYRYRRANKASLGRGSG